MLGDARRSCTKNEPIHTDGILFTRCPFLGLCGVHSQQSWSVSSSRGLVLLQPDCLDRLDSIAIVL